MIAGCPTLIALFAIEPALSAVEGVGILTSSSASRVLAPLRGFATGRGQLLHHAESIPVVPALDEFAFA